MALPSPRAPHRPRALRSSGSLRSTGAFTITELLVYVALAGVLAATAALNVITNIRTTGNLELRQRAVDDFGRINFFLQSEIAEGESIRFGNAEPLPGGCGPGQQLFTIVIPPDATRQGAFIHYYSRADGRDLWRCGPAINTDGELEIPAVGNPIAYLDARVNNNTRLTLFNIDDAQSVHYSLDFLSPRDATLTLSRGSAAIPLVARTGVQPID
jgi:hypothetical protein